MNVLFCIWLALHREEKSTVDQIIQSLATYHSLPVFQPHVTIASAWSKNGSELDELKAKEWFRLIGDQDEFPEVVQFGPLRAGENRHQCVLVDVQQGPGIRKKVLTALQNIPEFTTGDTEFTPHMSLVYGDISSEQRNSLIDAYYGGECRLPPTVRMAGLQLWRVPQGRPESEWTLLASSPAAALHNPPPESPVSPAAGAGALAVGAGALAGGGPPAPAAAAAGAEGLGDTEDCPWHVSAPAYWDMYEFRLSHADPDL